MATDELPDGRVRFAGLDLGRGTPYRVVEVEGLRGVEVRSDDKQQPRGDGGIPVDHHLDLKRPTLTVLAVGDYDDVVPPLLAAFRARRRGEQPLEWREEQQDMRLMCRPVSAPIVRSGSTGGRRVTEVTVGLRATDPRVYGVARQVSVPVFAADSGGWDYPIDYPKDAAEGEQAEAVAHNGGDSDAHPLVRVFGSDAGPIEAFTLENRTNGSRLEVDFDGLSVGPILGGQQLAVRMREWVTRDATVRPVELDSTNAYAAWVSRGEPFWLSPGDNVLRWSVDGPGDVAMLVDWRDTRDGNVRDHA